jgi:hypothetical protein
VRHGHRPHLAVRYARRARLAAAAHGRVGRRGARRGRVGAAAALAAHGPGRRRCRRFRDRHVSRGCERGEGRGALLRQRRGASARSDGRPNCRAGDFRWFRGLPLSFPRRPLPKKPPPRGFPVRPRASSPPRALNPPSKSKPPLPARLNIPTHPPTHRRGVVATRSPEPRCPAPPIGRAARLSGPKAARKPPGPGPAAPGSRGAPRQQARTLRARAARRAPLLPPRAAPRPPRPAPGGAAARAPPWCGSR